MQVLHSKIESLEHFAGKYKPFVILALFGISVIACYFSPWLSEDTLLYAVDSKTNNYYEKQSALWLATDGAIQFSSFWSYNEMPFGREVQLRYEVHYENGTIYSWANHYFVDPLLGFNYLYNNTVPSESIAKST